LQIGECIKFKNGVIGRAIEFRYQPFETKLKSNRYAVKLRCVSSCKGKHSSEERIGKPYTYQRWAWYDVIIRNLKEKKIKIIGTEEILEALFNNESNKNVC